MERRVLATYLDRMNGLNCVNGSRLHRSPRHGVPHDQSGNENRRQEREKQLLKKRCHEAASTTAYQKNDWCVP